MAALECLQRAFEIAINYSVYNRGASSNILKLRYDTELLVTGKKSKKSLSERYTEAKKKTPPPQQKPASKKPKKQQVYTMKASTPQKKFPIFLTLVGLTSAISLGMIITLFLIIKF